MGLTVRAGLVEEEPAGRVAADQIVDEGQQDEEGGGRSHQSQSRQPLGEGCHQVGRQVTGETHTHTRTQMVEVPEFGPCVAVDRALPLAEGAEPYLELRKRSARWKKRARYLAWRTEGSSRL